MLFKRDPLCGLVSVLGIDNLRICQETTSAEGHKDFGVTYFSIQAASKHLGNIQQHGSVLAKK